MSVTQPSDSRPILALRDATIGYDGRPVVRHADLDVNRGDVVALLGANGSGKTTLVRGVLGLAEVLDGSVTAFGVPIARLRRRWRIGYVPQRSVITSGVPATVTEVVASGRVPRLRPWRRLQREDRTSVCESIAAVGLDAHARTVVSKLSGGQQRRVLIARALAAEAELLLLDEPSAGVDLATQRDLAGTMAALVEQGATIVLVAHELGPAAAIVNRAVELHDGAVVYDGPPRPSDLSAADAAHHHGDERRRGVDRFGLTG